MRVGPIACLASPSSICGVAGGFGAGDAVQPSHNGNNAIILAITESCFHPPAMTSCSRAAMIAMLLLGCRNAGPGAAVPETRESVGEESVPLGRLPADVKPTRYRLDLAIAPAKERFSGTIEIDVEIANRRSWIWLHGAGQRISLASLTPSGKPTIGAKIEQAHEGGVLKMSLSEPAPAGRAMLKIVFDAPLGQHQSGLYRSTRGGHHYAFTQFEPVWARHAFPCFDEPGFKTPWEVSLTVPEGEVAIANTKEIGREKVGDGGVRVRFAPTEPLPSYLLAFAVGPLDVVEAPAIPASRVRAAPLPFRGIAARGRGKELAYAMTRTPAIVAYLEDYFGIAYPYDKLDIIAVPDRSGAMENAGAITFREWLLLLDESSPFEQRRSFHYVMAHELAHQWFGNLVTMPWWDDIWLNEAFATWMGFRAIRDMNREYLTEVAELTGVLDTMGFDALMSARQIRQPVAVNEEIHAAFDSITYRKGGAVLGMFERWLGPEPFRDALRAYMEKHRHGHATADDLLRALDEVTHKNVAVPFRTFLDQPGLPHLVVEPSCKADGVSVRVSQSRYLPIGSTGDRKKLWRVPVCLRFGRAAGVSERCQVIDSGAATVDLQTAECPAWIMPNADSGGYYAWSLSREWLTKLTSARSALTVRERMGLARAIRTAYASGAIDGATALEAALPLIDDANADVAGAAMGYFRDAHRWLEGDPLRAAIVTRARSTYRPALDALGIDGQQSDTIDKKLLRRSLIAFLGSVGDDRDIARRAQELSRKFLGIGHDDKLHPDAIDRDVTGVWLQIAGESVDAGGFDAIMGRLEQADSEELRGNLLRAAGSPRGAELSARARSLAIDPRLRQTEVLQPLFLQMNHAATRKPTWDWLKLHIDGIIDRLPPRFAGTLPSLASELCEPVAVEEVRHLFEPRLGRLAGAQRTLDNTIESIQLCIARKGAQLPSLRKFFEAADTRR
jgi:alanyl aminopeptidase